MKSAVILAFVLLGAGLLTVRSFSNNVYESVKTENTAGQNVKAVEDSATAHPMQITALRNREYPGNDLVIEEELTPQPGYRRYIASYTSDGLKIYGLLTIPNTPQPDGGFPVILFLHGYVAPATYITTRDYAASQDGLARAGFITYKPDFRGHGRSEGEATGAHFSEAYVVDTLNAISTFKNYDKADPGKIALWGHSNGGEIGLRTMVISKDIKAGVFWAGVVGSFEHMLETYLERIPFLRNRPIPLFDQYGKPSENPEFWNSIDPYTYLPDISAPVQLHHGTADSSVPVELSRHLAQELEKAGKAVELYEYPGAEHSLSGAAFGSAMQRSVEFFREHMEI